MKFTILPILAVIALYSLFLFLGHLIWPSTNPDEVAVISIALAAGCVIGWLFKAIRKASQ